MNVTEQLTINTLRLLSAQAIEKANSGHPGIALGCAPMAYQLWAKHLNHNPENCNWINRDRFVLSAGHGSALLYSLLHLFGYGLTIDDLKNFRQLGSKTPGHPEYGNTRGVEVTTGPLGQGFANAVGMAVAENHMAAIFNKSDYNIIDHYTYVLCGDGCMMEGITSEAASLAGSLGLGKLIVLYDSNNITIEGDTSVTFTENVLDRFKSYNWHTLKVNDGNDINSISEAITEAKNEKNKPTIIEIKTVIGFGSPNKSGDASSHGAPLGKEELELTKKSLNWNYEEDFYVPDEVKQNMQNIKKRLTSLEENWNKLFNEYKNKFPECAEQLKKWYDDKYFEELLNDKDFWNYDKDMATRISSEEVLNKISVIMPNIFGGSADLAPSTKTVMKNKEFYSHNIPSGSNVHFGVREHAMTAIANGIMLHGGMRPYIAGFFVFSDYMKPSLRLSALMKLPVISIFTHDSIGVGEDGPTHQPIEQLAALRSIPNYTVFRPCDTKETAAGWYCALSRKNSPTSLILTRQTTKLLKETGKEALKGAYILKDSQKEIPDIILMASGSEVELIYEAYNILKQEGIEARVVSIPSFEIFEEQDEEYKNKIFPKNVTKRLAVEAGVSFGWHKYIGFDGDIICMDNFGQSAPFAQLFEKYGFTVENVVNRALNLLK